MRSLSGGFSMKSQAPSFTASTAVLTVPWPERITTGGPPSCSFSRFRTSSPSIWGILTSRKTRSGDSCSAIFSPTGPFAASSTSYPSYSKIILREERTASSSSMISTLGLHGRFSTSTRVTNDVRWVGRYT